MQLTVYYDGQFWVGVFEDLIEDEFVVAQHVFGSEPSCREILMFVQELYFPLLFHPHGLHVSTQNRNRQRKSTNPKKLAREAARAVLQHGASTKSQEAIKLQMAEGKVAAREQDREEREAERTRRRQIAQSKALKRHQGH